MPLITSFAGHVPPAHLTPIANTSPEMDKIKVLIADDHEIVRKGLKQILLEGFSFVDLDEAADCPTLVQKAMSGNWDIIVSDLAMPGGGGLEALKQIRLQLPGLPVLILSIYPEEQYALRVMRAGAAGYLTKDAAPDELVSAIKRILSGKRYITQGIAERLANDMGGQNDIQLHELLSDREMDVLKLLAGGKSISEISELLAIGATTVSTYRSRILTKMHMRNNVDLTRYCIDNKLV